MQANKAVARYVSQALFYNPETPPHIFTSIVPYKCGTLVIKFSQYSKSKDYDNFENDCRIIARAKFPKYITYSMNDSNCDMIANETNECDVVDALINDDVRTEILELTPVLYPTISTESGIHLFCAINIQRVTLQSFGS